MSEQKNVKNTDVRDTTKTDNKIKSGVAILLALICVGMAIFAAMAARSSQSEGQTSSGNLRCDVEMVAATSIPKYTFSVPKEVLDTSMSYRDMMIEVAGGMYTNAEKASSVRMEYSNLYNLTMANNSMSISAYSPNSSIDIKTLDESNAEMTVKNLLKEMTFEVNKETGTYWGIDTTNEFYAEFELDMENAEREINENVQKIMIPMTSRVSYLEYTEDGSEVSSATTLGYSGWVAMITENGNSTKLLMAYSQDGVDMGFDMKVIADSFTYNPESVGVSTAFDKEEILSIEEESEKAIQEAMSAIEEENGLEFIDGESAENSTKDSDNETNETEDATTGVETTE